MGSLCIDLRQFDAAPTSLRGADSARVGKLELIAAVEEINVLTQGVHGDYAPDNTIAT